MTRGLGCVLATQDEAWEDELRRPLVGLVGHRKKVSLPHAVSYRHLVSKVFDQGPTNSCVANWFAMAIWLRGQIVAAPVPMPSRRWAYTVARYGDEPGKQLLDEGSSARVMCMKSQRHGIIAETRLPFEPAKINEPPPFDADIAGADAEFTGWYRAGVDPLELQQALADGYVPGMAISVFPNFENWPKTSKAYEETSGDLLGYHMVTITGYRTNSDGSVDFEVLNSWGDGWADGGFLWMSDRFVGSRKVFDRHVVTSAPISR